MKYEKNFTVLLMVLLILVATNLNAQALHWLSQPDGQLGQVQNGNHWNFKSSSNNRYLSFLSYASNLVVGDDNQQLDLYVYDRQTKAIQRISATNSPQFPAEAIIREGSAPTSDGQWVAFMAVGDLGFGLPANPIGKVLYLKNLVTGAVNPVSLDGSGGLFSVNQMHLTDDGMSLFFTTKAQLDPIHTSPFFSQLYKLDLTDNSFTLLSVATDKSSAANADIRSFAASPNGRFIALSTSATNLSDLTSTLYNVFLIDFEGDEKMDLVTVRPDGSPSEYNSGGQAANVKAVSDNGQVAYVAINDDLVQDDNNDEEDLFLFNVQKNGANNDVFNTRISVDKDGNELIEPASYNSVMLSGIGNTLAFSDSNALVDDDTNEHTDVYAYDVETGLLVLVTQPIANNTTFFVANVPQPLSYDGQTLLVTSSINHSGTTDDSYHQMLFEFELDTLASQHINPVAFKPQTIDEGVGFPQISSDQMTVVYSSRATNLTAQGVINEAQRLFLLDRRTDTHQHMATWGFNPSISPSGKYVVFSSIYTQPHGDTLFDTPQVFLYDADSKQYTPIASGSHPSVNDAGQVAFSSSDSLTENDTNASTDIYLYDADAGGISLISVNLDGESGSSSSSNPVISGSHNDASVVFLSYANDLIENDKNSQRDVFVRSITSQTTRRVSENSDHIGANDFVSSADISYTGEYITFRSMATNLTDDIYTSTDLSQGFFYNQTDASIQLYSLNQQGVSAELGVDSASISDSGKYIAYATQEQVLPEDTDESADVYLYDTDAKTTQLISKFIDGQQSSDIFSLPELVEDLEVSPPLLGVAFIGRGDLTGISGHPGEREAFLYQQGGPDVNLNIVINGSGEVSDSQSISCMTHCDYSFALGTDLTLIASPESGFIFDRWQSSFGQCTDDTNPCVLTIDREKQLTAVFIDENDVIFVDGFD